MALQIRRGLEADRVTFAPSQGELLYTTDDKKLYIGDGVTAGGNPVGGGDIVTETTATQFVHNQHSNLTFTYDVGTGRIIGSIPNFNIQIAATDSTVRTVNLGETIKFSGSGGTSVTSDVEGNITIDSLTYNIEAVSTAGGANLRLQSTLSLDDVSFIGAGSTTVTRTDANTITISSTGGGGGGTLDGLSDVIISAAAPGEILEYNGSNWVNVNNLNTGNILEIAYYSGTRTLSGNVSLTYNPATATLTTSKINLYAIKTSNPNFTIINNNNGTVTFGGTDSAVEYSGKILTLDVSGFDPVNFYHNQFYAIHNDPVTNPTAFLRARGTIASPTKVADADSLGSLAFYGHDGVAFHPAGIMGVIVETEPVTGSGKVPSLFAIQLSNSTSVLNTVLSILPDGRVNLYGDLFFPKQISNNTIKIQNNVIETIVSNANLEFRTSGTGAIYLDNISINQGTIDTLDSSAVVIEPAAIFNSDVTVQNNLVVTNKIYAEEFVSTSNVTPEISATTQLAIKVGNKEWDVNANGTLQYPILSSAPSAPANGMMAIADGTGWNPLGLSGKQQMVVYLGGGWRQVAVEP